MIAIEIFGGQNLALNHLVMDYNGTIAVDGRVITGVKRLLYEISKSLKLHVVTADTFGNVKKRLSDTPCAIHVLNPADQDRQKLDYINHLGRQNVAAVGNGKNDLLMLEKAALGIAVVLAEGAFFRTLAAADIVCTDIISALELLIHSKRLQATLRV